MREGKLRHLQPDFYESFRCRASACRHSCCRGWEIDIDENTLELYRGLRSSTGACAVNGKKKWTRPLSVTNPAPTFA